MGKFFDALQKSTLFKDREAKPQTVIATQLRPKDEAVKIKKMVDPLRIEQKVCQMLPEHGLLASCSLDDDVKARFATDQIRMLRSKILFPKDKPFCRTIMVTSTAPNEGKTFVASNLAASMTLDGQHQVVLIECDIRRPSMAKFFGMENSAGLSEYLNKEVEAREVFRTAPIRNLLMVLGGRPAKNPYELLTSERMLTFIKQVRNRYERSFIILDTSPLQVAAETSVLGNLTDGTILVVASGRSSNKAIQDSLNQLGQEKIIGLVFNLAEGKSSKEYYYREYYR